jgi:CheY-like chemotaxis protein
VQSEFNFFSDGAVVDAMPRAGEREAAALGTPEPASWMLQMSARAVMAQRKVLYVDDNPVHLELVQALFARRPDLQLLTATDGDQGIQLARTQQPGVILMDIGLPDMSGIDALKFLRAEPSTAHIPIIALSANGMQHDVNQGMAAGFFGYITKPFKVNELWDVLDIALAFSNTGSALAARHESTWG